MKALRWFQTKVGLFQDPRMMYLLNQPHGVFRHLVLSQGFGRHD
ncbi:hypothetical protein [Megasphaera stantonii]|nr:hypothetical protein [Megasphaera stantonii]